MKHYVLTYDFVPGFRDKRAPHRAAHLAHAHASAARDELQLGGAFNDDPPQGMVIIKAETPATAEAFAAGDPYVAHGVVTAWRVREWVTVVGANALTKL